MTALEAAAAVRERVSTLPNTRQVSAVSVAKSGATTSPFQSILGIARVAKDVALDIFAPSELSVPGTAPIARSVAKGATRVADAAAGGIKDVAASATKGIQSGFKTGTLILVLIVGLWAWSVVRPR